MLVDYDLIIQIIGSGIICLIIGIIGSVVLGVITCFITNNKSIGTIVKFIIIIFCIITGVIIGYIAGVN